MNNEPPNINSTGDRPTNLGDGAGAPERGPQRERDASQPEPGARSGAPEGFQIPASDGDLDTYQAEQQLGQFVESGSELPPELVEEQKAVLLKKGDVVADRFEVVKQLGFGGMGAVYHVKDRYTRQDRALKVMLPSLLKNQAARERFRSEVTISQKLSHENIVRVHDLAADQKRKFYFFTMELVEGRTLNRLLRDRGGKLPLDEALDIIRQLCDALEYAHKHTIHRDLKPQNIMIRPDGSIKVLDFGLAKLMSPGRMTRSSMALGTAYYQAPEQSIHLSELDQRADIYSMGVMFYQMLTGEIPVGAVQPPSSLVSGLPKALDNVIMACLDPKAEGRPQSAAALRGAVDQAARKRRAKWVAPAVIAGVVGIVVIGVVYSKLGTVPSRPASSGTPLVQSPISPSESSEAPVSPISESENVEAAAPSPPEPEPSVAPEKPSATAADASTARQAAVAAQQAAQKAGAQEHALDLWDEAVKALKQAEAHDTLEAFADAIGGYEQAEKAFKEAETEATRIAGEIEALDKAKSAMETAKSEAQTLDAAQYAKVRYEQAVKSEEEAVGIDNDRIAAARAYEKAAQRYQLAIDETRQQGAAIVAAAKKSAETAKEKANTSDVKKYSAKEVEAAQALFDQAANASDFQETKGLYEQAAAKYAEAVDEAGSRKEAEAMQVARAKADMEKAREAAQTVKAMIGADERKYAEKEVAAGDAAWSNAEAAATDYAKAEGFYAEARTQYAKAIEAAPERKKAEVAKEAGRKALLGPGVRAGEERKVDLGDGVSMELVWIPQGEFMMGSKFSPKEAASRFGGKVEYFEGERPQHKVGITQGFWMGKYEVTQAQWQAVMGSNPSEFKGDRNPVETISWNDCQEFVKKLSQKAGATFRLPTEAEWEYACRACSTTAYCFGDDESRLADYAWFDDNSGKQTHSVGQKKPNAWGLYDMHGNAWEWCEDWYDADFYSKSPERDPLNTSTGDVRVLRGGSWNNGNGSCRSAFRSGVTPAFTYSYLIGFRVVCVSSR